MAAGASPQVEDREAVVRNNRCALFQRPSAGRLDETNFTGSTHRDTSRCIFAEVRAGPSAACRVARLSSLRPNPSNCDVLRCALIATAGTMFCESVARPRDPAGSSPGMAPVAGASQHLVPPLHRSQMSEALGMPPSPSLHHSISAPEAIHPERPSMSLGNFFVKTPTKGKSARKKIQSVRFRVCSAGKPM